MLGKLACMSVILPYLCCFFSFNFPSRAQTRCPVLCDKCHKYTCETAITIEDMCTHNEFYVSLVKNRTFLYWLIQAMTCFHQYCTQKTRHPVSLQHIYMWVSSCCKNVRSCWSKYVKSLLQFFNCFYFLIRKICNHKLYARLKKNGRRINNFAFSFF